MFLKLASALSILAFFSSCNITGSRSNQMQVKGECDFAFEFDSSSLLPKNSVRMTQYLGGGINVTDNQALTLAKLSEISPEDQKRSTFSVGDNTNYFNLECSQVGSYYNCERYPLIAQEINSECYVGESTISPTKSDITISALELEPVLAEIGVAKVSGSYIIQGLNCRYITDKNKPYCKFMEPFNYAEIFEQGVMDRKVTVLDATINSILSTFVAKNNGSFDVFQCPAFSLTSMIRAVNSLDNISDEEKTSLVEFHQNVAVDFYGPSVLKKKADLPAEFVACYTEYTAAKTMKDSGAEVDEAKMAENQACMANYPEAMESLIDAAASRILGPERNCSTRPEVDFSMAEEKTQDYLRFYLVKKLYEAGQGMINRDSLRLGLQTLQTFSFNDLECNAGTCTFYPYPGK